MVQAVCRFFGQRYVNLDECSPTLLRLNIQQTVDQFRTFAQIDHPQTATFIVSFGNSVHVEAHAIILDLQQGKATFQLL